MEKAIVGLSGGVDSFVTAFLLQQQGFEVIGVNLQLWKTKDIVTQEKELSNLCERIGIKLYRVDGQSLFSHQVVRPFVEGYLSGITPNPCSICNSFVKWHLLQSLADDLGIHHIATGHYVRILPFENHVYVNKGIDPNKDQSYFLWGVKESILSRAITPLGDYTKTEVKEIARVNGFTRIAEKRESMSICFLEGGDYRDFIARQPDSSSCFRPGFIIDRENNLLGEHSGIVNYTIGQKKDIPLKGQHPQYVAKINANTNQIIVGDKSSLFQSELIVDQVHLIHPDEIYTSDIEVKVRGLGLNPEGHARITRSADNTLSIQLATPAWAAAPGQPVALYRNTRVIGGGVLT